jgi:hypothetical protein
VTFDIKPSSSVLDHGDQWTRFQGDLGNMGEVLTAIQAHKPKTIFHLVNVSTFGQNLKPLFRPMSSVSGNVLEAACSKWSKLSMQHQ